MTKISNMLLVVSSLLLLGVGCERTGTVAYEDCRTVINLEEDNVQKNYRTFTCDYKKTEGGVVMGGTCVRVELGGYFDTGPCNEAFVYDLSPEVVCSNKYPYLGYDDKCYQEWDYGHVRAVDDK